jgi:hypothetical protein
MRFLPQDQLIYTLDSAQRKSIFVAQDKSSSMAISNNILVAALSGSLGKQIVFRRYGNKTVVSSFPDMTNRKLSAKQKAVNENIKKATARAKEIIADP